jgi:molybdopterin synthase sulfur carrier subunit
MTHGADKVELDVDDLSQMIDRLESDYPGFKERLLDEEGELRYFVNIYVNGEDIRFDQGLKTSIKSGDEISIVPAVAGG